MVSEALQVVEVARGLDATDSFNPLGVLLQIRIAQARYNEAKELGQRLNALAEKHYGEMSPEVAQATHMMWIVAYRTANYEDMVS